MSLFYPLLLLLGQSGAEAGAIQSAEDTSECAEPITQLEMNTCAAQEWAEADAELNRQWRETADAMRALDASVRPDDDRPGYYGQLLRAQRAWLVYRDHHCTNVGYYARGGSMEPLLATSCRTEVTRDRTRQLRELADWPG